MLHSGVGHDRPVPARHAFAAVPRRDDLGRQLRRVVIERGLVGDATAGLRRLRFLVVIAAIPFVARPSGPLWKVLVVRGAAMSLGQFAFLYSSLDAGMPPGLAS